MAIGMDLVGTAARLACVHERLLSGRDAQLGGDAGGPDLLDGPPSDGFLDSPADRVQFPVLQSVVLCGVKVSGQREPSA